MVACIRVKTGLAGIRMRVDGVLKGECKEGISTGWPAFAPRL